MLEMTNKLRIGSRGSQLALWQANHISALLRARGHEVEIEIIHTAVHLCGSLVAGPQLSVVENIKKLFALPQRRETETEEEPHIPHWMTFGQALLYIQN